MKPIFGSFLLATLLLICCRTDQAAVKLTYPTPRHEMIEDALRDEYLMTRDPEGKIPKERLIHARDEMSRRTLARVRHAPELLAWEHQGPDAVGGRTRALLVDARDSTSNTVWAGSVSGGLWKTVNFLDAAPTWHHMTPGLVNLAIGALAQDPVDPEIFYMGTGEGWFNGDAARGVGIFKSTDGGQSWELIPTTDRRDFAYTQKIIFDKDGNIYAATRGLGADNVGVVKSDNSFISWRQVLGTNVGAGNSNRGTDLEIAANGDLYASIGHGQNAGAVFKSSRSRYGDRTGDRFTWEEITPVGFYNRIEIATAPTDSNRIYLLCAEEGFGDVNAIFRSSDGGVSWDSLAIPTIWDLGNENVFSKGQAWYDLIVAVDPLDPDIVYIGGVDGLRSMDGGETWDQITVWHDPVNGGFLPGQYVHADHHSIVFLPGGSTRAVWGTDGGVAYSGDLERPVPAFTSKNSNYNVTQFYSVAMHPSTGMLLGGSQDNGTQRVVSFLGERESTQVAGGDGGFCHIDQDNPEIQVGSFTYSRYTVTRNGWDSRQNVSGPANYGRFINPSDYDSETNTLYTSFQFKQYGLLRNVGGFNELDSMVVPEFDTAEVSAVKVDPNVPNRVWMATSQSFIHSLDTVRGRHKLFSIDAANFVNPQVTEFQTPPVVSSAYLRNIDVELGNPMHLLVSFSNYGVESVWESNDGGESWISLQGDLPDMPVRWAIFDPVSAQRVLLGTEVGVWITEQTAGDDTRWIPASTGLGSVRTDMLKYRASDMTLAAATYGLGFFTAPALGLPTASTSGNWVTQAPKIFPNPFVDHFSMDVSQWEASSLTVRIYDLQGIQLKEHLLLVQGDVITLSTDHLSPGIYVVEVIRNHERYSTKIIKYRG